EEWSDGVLEWWSDGCPEPITPWAWASHTRWMPPPGGGVGWFLPGSHLTSLRGLLPLTLNLARPRFSNSISITFHEELMPVATTSPGPRRRNFVSQAIWLGILCAIAPVL